MFYLQLLIYVESSSNFYIRINDSLIWLKTLSKALSIPEAVIQRCSVKRFLEISQNSQENTCAEACNFIKKETLAQVFSCEFCKISKNTFFIEHLWRLLLVLVSCGFIRGATLTSFRKNDYFQSVKYRNTKTKTHNKIFVILKSRVARNLNLMNFKVSSWWLIEDFYWDLLIYYCGIQKEK